MTRRIVFLAILFVYIYPSFAQTISFRGKIVDAATKQALQNSTIYLLKADDSIIVGYARAKPDGFFEILLDSQNSQKKLLTIVSYPNYADFINEVLPDAGEYIVNIGIIKLVSKSKLLEELIVKGTAKPIQIKGDTTEYKVDSFYVPPNATVEDLLKKLPGIRIDKNGKIIAQGERVTQILVDGEEFFSSDPTLVSQIVKADAVEKVQVYDRKDNMGFVTNKVINLKIRQEKKSGYFGDASFGKAVEGFYNHRIMFNTFSGKRKYALYGNASSIGKSGFSSDEEKTFADGTLSNVNDDVGRLDDWNGNYETKGLPKLVSLGLHYNNIWNEERQRLNANYKLQKLTVSGIDTTKEQINLPDSTYFNNRRETFNNEQYGQSINGNFETQIDSTSTLKISVYGKTINRKSAYYYQSLAFTALNYPINSQTRNQIIEGSHNILNSSAEWTKKINGDKQRVIIAVTENYKNERENGFLFANDILYKNGVLNTTNITDQKKDNHFSRLFTETRILLSQKTRNSDRLNLGFSFLTVNSNSVTPSFNKSNTGKYEIIDSLYSSNFKFETEMLKANLGYTFIRSKFYVLSNFGFGKTYLSQKDFMLTNRKKSDFLNIFPRINFRYDFTAKKRIWINYEGASTNPTLQQIQNIKSNIDPLNILQGNSFIRPSFTHNFNTSYWSYKGKIDQEFRIRLKYVAVDNDIVTKVNVDSFRRTIYQFININGNRSFTENVEYSRNFVKSDIYFNIVATFKQNRFYNIVNDKLNVNNSDVSEISTGLSKSIEKKFDASINFTVNQTNHKSTVLKGSKIKYNLYEITPAVDMFLSYKIRIHTDCVLKFYKSNLSFLINRKAIIWSAWIEKSILNNNDLQFRFSINDLLNQNIGFAIDANTNHIRQSGFTVIKRYGLFSLAWNFNRNKNK